MSDREEFLTAKQLAEILQVSESTVRRLAQKRRIPSVRLTPRIIRFHLDAVREALEVPRVSRPQNLQIDDAQLSFEDLLSWIAAGDRVDIVDWVDTVDIVDWVDGY